MDYTVKAKMRRRVGSVLASRYNYRKSKAMRSEHPDRVGTSPLEDLYQIRTEGDRNGTLNQWNDALLQRDLERLIREGFVERVNNMREVAPDFREKTWYRETATGTLYMYVAGWERGAPEFRRHVEPVAHRHPNSIQ